MDIQRLFIGCFKVTMFTDRILDTLMFRFDMPFQIMTPCCFIVTLITWIFDNLMFGFDMP